MQTTSIHIICIFLYMHISPECTCVCIRCKLHEYAVQPCSAWSLTSCAGWSNLPFRRVTVLSWTKPRRRDPQSQNLKIENKLNVPNSSTKFDQKNYIPNPQCKIHSKSGASINLFVSAFPFLKMFIAWGKAGSAKNWWTIQQMHLLHISALNHRFLAVLLWGAMR